MIQKYKLLKDLPDLKAGHVFTWNKDTETYVSHSNNQHPDYYWFTENKIKDTEWFEPILSTTKLMFGGKEVNIVKGKYESTTMINCADFSCTLLHLKVLYDSIWELTNWNVENDKFKVKEIDGIELPFETITIGCQTDRIDKLKEIIDTATKLMK